MRKQTSKITLGAKIISPTKKRKEMEVCIYMIFKKSLFFSSTNEQFTTIIIDQWYSASIQYCPFNKESDMMS